MKQHSVKAVLLMIWCSGFAWNADKTCHMPNFMQTFLWLWSWYWIKIVVPIIGEFLHKIFLCLIFYVLIIRFFVPTTKYFQWWKWKYIITHSAFCHGRKWARYKRLTTWKEWQCWQALASRLSLRLLTVFVACNLGNYNSTFICGTIFSLGKFSWFAWPTKINTVQNFCYKKLIIASRASGEMCEFRSSHLLPLCQGDPYCAACYSALDSLMEVILTVGD